MKLTTCIVTGFDEHDDEIEREVSFEVTVERDCDYHRWCQGHWLIEDVKFVDTGIGVPDILWEANATLFETVADDEEERRQEAARDRHWDDVAERRGLTV